jgi:zinc-ribbon domain
MCGSKIPTSANFCPQCGEDTRDSTKLKTRMRFSWLKDMERRYASDYTRFLASGLPDSEGDKEEPVFDKARKMAKETNEPVMVHVVLREKRGEIGSLPWAVVEPDGRIEYAYP